MSTKQELRDGYDRMSEAAGEWRKKAIGLRRELDDALAELAAVRSERDAALAALTELRQADPLTTPAPRPFRVGDRVRVSEGATYRTASGLPLTSRAVGLFGQVTRIARDGDLWVHVGSGSGDWASPEFCTLIDPEPEPEPEPEPTPAPIARVRVVYESGGLSQDFDADGIAVMEAAPVYALLKDGAVVACVPVAGVRSVEVVR